ncbi:MAG: translocation/assembly module TamB domain-containing protein [Ferruginibacter sp.]
MLLVFLYGLLHLSSVQTWLVKKIAANLSEKLHTKVTVKSVDLRFFNKVLLQGVMVEDLKKDTLLYAGALKANVNDWFFFKDKISLQNVGLDDAIINMERTDSVWNYQFLIDFFAKPKIRKSAGDDVNIDLGELHFTNIKFNKIDGWIGQDMIANLGKLDVTMQMVDIKNKRIHIKEIYLEKPLFSQRDYTGTRPEQPNLKQIIEKIPVLGALKWNNGGWEIKLDKLDMKDGAFINDKFTEEPPFADRFDGKHLSFSSLTGSMKNLLFVKDTLTLYINLNAKERSGLQIKKLESNLKLTPEVMEFNNLDLVTNKSKLRDYYSMTYKSFQEDFSSFLHNVSLEAHFKESTLNSDDLAFFSPNLKSWKRIILLEGNVKGPLDNFSAKEMKIKTGNTVLEGSLAMRGLPDINSTFIDFQSNKLQTNYADIVGIVPQLKTVQKPAISKLGNVSFTGNFVGFIRDFVAYGTFNTGLGNLTADVNMKTPLNGSPAYSGSIASTGFNIGTFIQSPSLGSVALNAKLSGKGFNLNDLKAKVDGTVNSIGFNGYNYKNLVVNGDFEKKLFIGHFSIDDPNLKISSLDGALNLLELNPGFQLQANVEKADLKNLGLTKEAFSFAGNLDLNFTGNNIDNFLGTARISNASLLQKDNRLSFDSLTINSQIIDGKKSLSLSSNEVEANITGYFKIMELPDAVKVLLARYYPTYIKPPSYFVNSIQDLAFTIKTNNVDQYIKLIDPKLGGFNNSNISGDFNLRNYNLHLNATVPQFFYDKKEFTNTVLVGRGTKDTLVNDISIEDIVINDSLHLPNSKLTVATSNDLSFIKLNTSASKIFGDAELNASVQTMTDGVKIHFYPSSFIINSKKWQLEKDGELTLRKKFLDASEVKFFQNDQQIVLRTELSEENEDTHLVAELKNISLEDFAFILPPNPSFKGKVTGIVNATDIFGKTEIDFKGRADSFELDGRYMGRVNLQADANIASGLIKYKADAAEKDFDFAVNGSYNFKDSTGKSLQVNGKVKAIKLDFLQPYLNTVFSDMQGVASGDIEIKNDGENLTIIGNTIIKKGSFEVAYTQVRYNFDNQPIRFGKNLIDIGTMQITDTLGNKGEVSGKMYHKFFKEFSFDAMRFTSPKILLLNTTRKDNAQFYGKVIGRGAMTLNGDIANMKMNIDGEPSPTDSSHIYLPTGNSKESNVVDYIDFIQFGSLMDNGSSSKETTNLLVNMNLTANPACKIDVILDEATGDVIKGEGNGELNITVGTKEPLSMRGRYDLTKGEYTFNFQTFFKKPFALSHGSITWNGDPFLANIDMEAEYLAKNVDISSITSLTNVRQQEDITILSKITGTLKKPDISFDFQLPERSEFNRDFYVVKRLADFKNDANEMNKQVASLLLFNQFISNSQAFITGNSTLSIATSTIGGAVSSWLTSILSKALEKATNGIVSVLVDVNPSLNFQQANQLQANIRSSIKFRISKNLQLLVGGNLDYNNPITQLYSKGVITPDISLEWLINKDGSLRVVAFNRTSIDFTTGQRNRSGVQLSYRKEVDRLGDIFRSKKRIQKLDSLKFAPKKKT